MLKKCTIIVLCEFLVLIIISLGLGIAPAYGHVTGSSWENTVNGYKIDVGYDPVQIRAAESQHFDFDIFKPDPHSSEEEQFTDIWVRLTEGQNTIFATGIHKPDFGRPGMIFTFPKGGNYQMSVRFDNNEQTIAEESLPVTVLDEENAAAVAKNVKFSAASILSGGIWFVVGLVAGAGIVLLRKRKKI